ncbi:MAG: NAD(P)H-binding protein [Rhodoglobus sp.]|uniref:NAD(P)H-binding protein n=1 Tax=Salinibacterium sp. G-O1 TaxID=3046208 RepID=UPI0024BBB6E2|nr:NAD(P)H-binding protein [Salinibacterium sp. G-O1]MDJ0335073.1 NAD(P)H-binding protein [Salinibacterium sp. G-O1]
MSTPHHTPLRVAILGGSGKVAHELIVQLRRRGDDAVPIFRNADRVDELLELGAIPVVLDIEKATTAQLATALAGSDAVVFAAGAGGGNPARTRAVDYEGAVLAMAAASAVKVSRFVMVSSVGAGGPVPTEGDMAPYLQAKHDADEKLKATELRWTILRPGALTDEPATGLVHLADTVDGGSIPRADVAAVILAALDERSAVGQVWEFVSGSQPIADALGAQS